MLKLSKIEENGIWFPIPGKFFESDKVELKLSMISKKESVSAIVTERELNKKTKRYDDVFNMKKSREKVDTLIKNHILGWKGIEEKFTPENVDKFIKGFGPVVLIKESELETLLKNDNLPEKDIENLEKLEGVDLSEWIAETCKTPENFYTDDSENLVSTSQV